MIGHWIAGVAATLVLAQAPVQDRALITTDTLVLPAGASAPYLSRQGWVIDGKLTENPKKALLDWATRHKLCESLCHEEGRPFIYVSLGPNPTYGAFLLTTQSLREMGLCHNVFVKEGGAVEGAAASPRENIMTGLDVC
jgi:hypothetical protein